MAFATNIPTVAKSIYKISGITIIAVMQTPGNRIPCPIAPFDFCFIQLSPPYLKVI
jgi:hypothetical protein